MGNSEATKSRILEAANAEFATHGLAGARVDRIAATARCNKAQLYAYFGNKDALFDAVFTRQVEGNVDRIPLTPEDLPGYAARLYDGYVAEPALARLATWSRLERRPTGDLLSTEGTYQDNLAKISGAQHDGLLTPGIDPGELFQLLIGLASSWAQSSLTYTADRDDPAADHRRRRRALAETVSRAFCRSSPGTDRES